MNPEQKAEHLEAELVKLTDERNGLVDTLADTAARLRAAKGEITKRDGGGVGNAEVREVFDRWVERLGKNANTVLGANRAALIRRAIREHGKERILTAIEGLALRPYTSSKGRQKQGSKAQRVDDIKYAIRDEETVERCCRYIETEWAKVWRHQHWEALGIVKDPVAAVKEEVRANYGFTDTGQGRWQAGDLELVLNRLAQAGCDFRENGAGRYMAQCPHHDDRSPSLSLRECDDGTVLLNCFAGCPTHDVLTALNLDWKDIGRPFRETDFKSFNAWQKELSA